MRWLAIAFGLVIAVIGIVGLVDPGLFLDATSFTLASLGLCIVAAIRIAFGLVLIGAATTSRMPRALRILGALFTIEGNE